MSSLERIEEEFLRYADEHTHLRRREEEAILEMIRRAVALARQELATAGDARYAEVIRHAVAEEREACAKALEALKSENTSKIERFFNATLDDAVAAIRNRGRP